jgi:hypothetical protein
MIEKLNLELKVARTNANAKTDANVSYANLFKGTTPFPTPPPPLMSTPPPGAQPRQGEDEELVTLLRGIMAGLSKRQL